jgi:hypothetical protein
VAGRGEAVVAPRFDEEVTWLDRGCFGPWEYA